MPGTEGGARAAAILNRIKVAMVIVFVAAMTLTVGCNIALVHTRPQAPDPANGFTHMLHPVPLGKGRPPVYVTDGEYTVSRVILAIGGAAFVVAAVLREIERRRAGRSASQ